MGAMPTETPSTTPIPDDAVTAFQIEGEPVRGRLARLGPAIDEILRRHATAMDEGNAGYLDPATGLFVITAATHLQRGKCCTNGCRHCPYV